MMSAKRKMYTIIFGIFGALLFWIPNGFSAYPVYTLTSYITNNDDISDVVRLTRFGRGRIGGYRPRPRPPKPPVTRTPTPRPYKAPKPKIPKPPAPRKVPNYSPKLKLPFKKSQAALSKNLGPGKGKATHVIPFKNRNHKVIQKAARGGFNFNGKPNGIRMPNGTYPKNYSNMVLRRLNRIDKITAKSGFNDKQTAALVRNHARSLKTHLGFHAASIGSGNFSTSQPLPGSGFQRGNVVASNNTAHEAYKRQLRTRMEKPVVRDKKLQKEINKLYRPNAEVGSGSTAAAIRRESASGLATKGTFHAQKGNNSIAFLEKWLANNPEAAQTDRMAVKSIILDLKDSLGR